MAIVVPITSSWNPKGLDRAVKDIQRAEGSFKKFSVASNILSASLIDTGKNLTRNVTVPLVALGIAVNKSITDASNLAEAQAKVGAVFGSQAGEIQKWAKTMATSFGVSSRQALEAAGTYGNLFQAFGIGQTEARKMSTRLVELAADMASFNNVPIDEALTALRSGLSGETEPLKRFGVALNDVRLKQVALNMGIYDGTGNLDVAAKAQAAYQLVLKDTALQQGDVARTAEGLANQKKFLAAQVENLSGEFGSVFIPIMISAIGQIRTQFLPQVQKLIDAFKALSPQTINMAVKFALVAAALGPVMIALGYTIKLVMGLAQAFMFLMKRVVIIPLIVLTFVTSIVKAQDATMTWGQAVYKVARGIVIAFVQIGNAVITVINWIIKAENAFAKLRGTGESWNEIKWNLDPLIKGVDAAYVGFSQFGQKMSETTQELTGLANGAQDVVDGLGDTPKGVGGAANKAAEAISGFQKKLNDAKQTLDDAKQKFKDFATTISGAVKSVINFGSAATAETGSFLENLISQADKAKEFASRISQLIKLGLSERAITQVLDAGAEAGIKIADEIIAGGATIVDQVNTIVAATETLADQVGNYGAEAFYKAGIIQGQALVDGVLSAIRSAGLTVDAEGNISSPAVLASASQGATGAPSNTPSNLVKTVKTGSFTQQGLMNKLAKIPMMAEGGIVKKPTIAMIGEAGAEAVVPLNKMPQGNKVYNITVNAGMGTNGTQVGKEIVDAIKRYERTSGPVFASA